MIVTSNRVLKIQAKREVEQGGGFKVTDIVADIPLEEECQCAGTPIIKCAVCGDTGFVPSEAGRAIIEFMNRYCGGGD